MISQRHECRKSQCETTKTTSASLPHWLFCQSLCSSSTILQEPHLFIIVLPMNPTCSADRCRAAALTLPITRVGRGSRFEMLLDRLEQIGGRPLIGKNARRPKATRRGIDPALVSALAPPEPRIPVPSCGCHGAACALLRGAAVCDGFVELTPSPRPKG